MSNIVYNEFIYQFMLQQLNVQTAVLRVALFSSGYTPNPDDLTYSAISAFEITGNNYTAGGKVLDNVSLEKDTSNDIIKMHADLITWESSTITAQYAVIYEEATGTLLACFDFETQKTSLNGNFSIEWPAEGIIQIGGQSSTFGCDPYYFTLTSTPVEE
jgi:hypothetical protein